MECDSQSEQKWLKVVKAAPTHSWTVTNPQKHFDAHFNITTTPTRTKRVAVLDGSDIHSIDKQAKRSRQQQRLEHFGTSSNTAKLAHLQIEPFEDTQYEDGNPNQEKNIHKAGDGEPTDVDPLDDSQFSDDNVIYDPRDCQPSGSRSARWFIYQWRKVTKVVRSLSC